MQGSTETRVVFMGSPEFALDTLRALNQTYDVVGVVTQPDRRAGRGRKLQPPPIKELADELGLPAIQPAKLRDPEAMQQVRAWAPDLIIVAAYGQILRPEVLELPSRGCINVHASLLPRWRGAAPIQAAILHGDAQTGISIMRMDAGLDTGPVLSQRAIPIAPDETAASLSEKLAALGAKLLIETLPPYLAGELRPQPQDDEQATYAPMLKKENGALDLSQPAEQLERQVRAYHPWPGSFLQVGDERIKVHRARVGAGASDAPGKRAILAGLPAVATAEGWLLLEEVQAPGKKAVRGEDYLRGARNWSDTSEIHKETQ